MAGFLASGFSAEIHRRTDTFEEAAMSDGKISLHEANRLEQYRESLGLTEAQALSLIKTAVRKRRKYYNDVCPHCKKSLTDAPESTKPASGGDSEKHA